MGIYNGYRIQNYNKGPSTALTCKLAFCQKSWIDIHIGDSNYYSAVSTIYIIHCSLYAVKLKFTGRL